MKILAITNLFPNQRDPHRGIFNQQQFQALSKLCELRVVAPLPWFPATLRGETSNPGHFIASEEIVGENLCVYHPRYFMTPKFGRSLYGLEYYLGIRNVVKEIHKTFSFEAILATWAYPDAFAGALVAKAWKKPLVIKVHGSDINLADRYFLRRRMIRYAFDEAAKIIAVSNDLREKVVAIGADGAKVEVVGNGIDRELFHPMDQRDCRKRFGLDRNQRHLVYIGNLVELKGLQFLVEAVSKLPANVVLHLVGDGPMKDDLLQAAKRLKIVGRVAAWGKRPHAEVPYWLNAADVLVLPSLHEGCPNVLLESIACGTPVVASQVGGIPDIIDHPTKGMLVEPGNAVALANAMQSMLEKSKEQTLVEQISPLMTWTDNARRVHALLESSVDARRANH